MRRASPRASDRGLPGFGCAVDHPPHRPQCLLLAECNIQRSRIDVRFRGKSGRAADITGTTGFGPEPAIGRIEIPQRSSLLAYWGVLSFRSEAREVLIAVHTVQVSAADQAISLLRDLHQRQGADAAIDAAKVNPQKRLAGC